MQEIRYDDQEKRLDDRLTERASVTDVETALRDKATRQVILHKPGSVFWVRAQGKRRRYRVTEDGGLVEAPKRGKR